MLRDAEVSCHDCIDSCVSLCASWRCSFFCRSSLCNFSPAPFLPLNQLCYACFSASQLVTSVRGALCDRPNSAEVLFKILLFPQQPLESPVATTTTPEPRRLKNRIRPTAIMATTVDKVITSASRPYQGYDANSARDRSRISRPKYVHLPAQDTGARPPSNATRAKQP